MKPVLFAILAFIGLSAFAVAPTGSDARAHELINALGLKPLPKESGYLGLIGESAQRAAIDGRSLAIQSQVYYMLTRDKPTNYLH